MNWLGFVDDAGNFKLDNSKGFLQAMRAYAGFEVIVSVKKRPKMQGTQSMRYYRGVVVPDIAAACGYVDPDEWEDVHNALAYKFLRLPDHPQLGTPRRRSTAKDSLSQEEMSRYIDQVILWAETSIPGCTIRRPEDVDMDKVVDNEWE